MDTLHLVRLSIGRAFRSFLVVTLLLAVAIPASAQVVVYRVNVGGGDTPAADATFPDWTEDQQEAISPAPILFAKRGINSPFVNADIAGDQTAGRNRADQIVLPNPLDPSIDPTLFNTQRWDPAVPAQNQVWRFPVASDHLYQFVLYFTELFGTGSGTRVFDVLADGQLVIDNLDVQAASGGLQEVVVVRSFEATDLDGDEAISIQLVSQIGIPILSAIEMLDLTSENSQPVAINPGNQVTEPGQPVSLQIEASDPDEDNLTFAAEGLPAGLVMSLDGVISGTPDSGEEGLFDIRVVVVDDGVPVRGTFVSFKWVIGSAAPELVDPIDDIVAFDTWEPVVIDLGDVFIDPAGLEVAFEVVENTNVDVVGAAVEGNLLELTFFPGERGQATISVRATNSDALSTDDVFSVEVEGGTPVALVQISPNSGLGASTFNTGMLVITNQSEGTLRIEHLKIDLTNALLPDMVFDPSGGAGDQGGKCLTPDSGASETGFVEPDDLCRDPFTIGQDGGFLAIELEFDDFDPGETFTFSVDVDPTSIKKARTVGESGSVAGIELAGSTVTATFTGEATWSNELFRIGSGGLGGAEATIRENLRGPLTLRIAGTDATEATFTDAAQTVIIEGTPGTVVRLLQLDAALNPEDSPDGGHDIDPFEANQAVTVLEYGITIDGDGVKEVPISLRMTITPTGLVGGLNHFIAVANDGGIEGRTSNALIMELVSADNVILTAGWNLVALSFDAADKDYDAVYAEVDPLFAPYGWSGAYVQTPTLEVGKGYWLNLPAAGTVGITGEGVDAVALTLAEGWNLIGGPACVVDEAAIEDPASIVVPGTIFEYDGVYHSVAQITQNRGYWVLTSAAGTINLACDAAVATKTGAPTARVSPEGFGTLTLRDAAGRSQALYFGGRLANASEKLRYSLPPFATQLAFDARFADDSRLAEGDATIRLHASDFPVALEVASLAGVSGVFEIEELVDGKVVATHPLGEGADVLLANQDTDMIRLRRVSAAAEELPEAFVLRGNYPNPFNPTTTVVFDLPESASVRLDVFDLLGRRVLALEPQTMDAGATRQLALDASALASGTYIYRLRADFSEGMQVQTGRMTLLK